MRYQLHNQDHVSFSALSPRTCSPVPKRASRRPRGSLASFKASSQPCNFMPRADRMEQTKDSFCRPTLSSQGQLGIRDYHMGTQQIPVWLDWKVLLTCVGKTLRCLRVLCDDGLRRQDREVIAPALEDKHSFWALLNAWPMFIVSPHNDPMKKELEFLPERHKDWDSKCLRLSARASQLEGQNKDLEPKPGYLEVI